MKINYFLIFLTVFFIHGCTNKKTNFNEEAIVFCDTFNLEKWKSTEMDSFHTMMINRNIKLNKNLSTKEFKEIVTMMSNEEYAGNLDTYRDSLYAKTKASIEKLTGEVWECEDFKQFHTFTLSSEPLYDDSKNKFVIIVHDSDSLSINGHKINGFTSELIFEYMSDQNIDSHEIIAIIKLDKTVYKENEATYLPQKDHQLTPIFDAAKKLKIQKISVELI